MVALVEVERLNIPQRIRITNQAIEIITKMNHSQESNDLNGKHRTNNIEELNSHSNTINSPITDLKQLT